MGLGGISWTLLPAPLHSVHELFLLALLVGGITLVQGAVWEVADFLTDATASFCSYLRRRLKIERRRDIRSRGAGRHRAPTS